MRALVFLMITISVSAIYAAPRANSHKMKRFITGFGHKDLHLSDKKLTPEELARVMHMAGFKDEEIPALVETIFHQNDWNEDNVIDQVELYGR